jgi:hypothetical protein
MKYIESLLEKGDTFKAIAGSGLDKCDEYEIHLDKK